MIKRPNWRTHWQLSASTLTLILAALLTILKLHLAASILLGIVTSAYAIVMLYRNWQDFRHGLYRLNILPVITIIAALVTRQFWFAAAVSIVSIISGRFAQDSLDYTKRGMAKRHAALPTDVTIVRGRKVVSVAVSAVHAGDKIVWAKGTLLPLDAQLLEGETTVTGRLLSGSIEASVITAGAPIASGSFNDGQEVIVRAEQTAASSYYQTVTRLLEKNLGDQTRFVRISDRYSIYFTVAALLIGAAAWYLGGYSGGRLLAVLAGATALPLLVSARIAISAALAQASAHGLVFRSGSGLQRLAEARTILLAFDGVMTDGHPKVTSVAAKTPYTKVEILGMAASLEQAVDHPLARAVVTAAQAEGFNFTRAKHVQQFAGQGLKATLQGKEILVGSAGLLTEHGITLPAKVTAKQHVIYVAAGSELVGTITLEHQLRPTALQTLNRLAKAGVRHLGVLSGAPAAVVDHAVGSAAKLTVHADAPVAEKLKVITEHSAGPVIFVGDSRSDASLYTAADSGVMLDGRSLHDTQGLGLTTPHTDIAYVGAAVAISRRAFGVAMVTIAVAGMLTLALMLVALSGLVPVYLALGLQLVINGFAVLYPLRASTTAIE